LHPQAAKARILALVLAVIFFNSLGNLALAWGMKHATETVGLNPMAYLRVMLNPAVVAGILLLICWLLTRMTLLSWADLSFVLPLTSLGYVMAAVLGKLFLNEVIAPEHWLGVGLIFVGTALVGTTQSKTDEEGSDA
jgi:uncharacterized membrane protein